MDDLYYMNSKKTLMRRLVTKSVGRLEFSFFYLLSVHFVIMKPNRPYYVSKMKEPIKLLVLYIIHAQKIKQFPFGRIYTGASD